VARVVDVERGERGRDPATIALGLVPPVVRWLVRLLVVVAIVLGLALVAKQWSAMHAPVHPYLTIQAVPVGAPTPDPLAGSPRLRTASRCCGP